MVATGGVHESVFGVLECGQWVEVLLVACGIFLQIEVCIFLFVQ